jgi:uroporphyrin-3 C-methyltransferase
MTLLPLMNKVTPLIAVAALVIAGYNYYLTHQKNTNLAQENTQLASQISQLKQQQNGFKQELNKETTDWRDSHQELTAKIKAFSTQVQTLSPKGNQSQDWLLLKARYYLELAQINAHWINSSGDQSTEALLQQADAILGQMNTAELFTIRQVIAKEILALKTAHQLDIPGLLSQLDALQSNIASLHLQTNLSFNTNAERAPEQSSSSSTLSNWQAHLQNSFDFLGKLVVVRRNDEEIKPLLSPIYESLLKENIRLNIQEAQWAILNHNSLAYQLALKQAIAILKKGFNEHLADTTPLVQQLTELQKINVLEEKIEVGEALPFINQLIEQKQLTSHENNNNKGGQKQ